MHIQGIRVLKLAPDTGGPDSSAVPQGVVPDLRGLNVALAPEQGVERIDGADGGSGMKSWLFRRWRKKARVEETRLEAGEISLHVMPANKQLTIAVAGRVTVDSSPYLRSALLELLRRGAASVVVIDVSALSYLDMSGIATLLEALKAAHEHSLKLRLAGMRGQVRALAEIAQLDTIYRNWGSEVEFS
jgi:anti-sigma B factor antagonist